MHHRAVDLTGRNQHLIARFQIVFPALHPVAYRSVQKDQQFVEIMIMVGIFPPGQVFKIKQPERTVEITAFLINIWHGSLLCGMLYKLVIVSIQHYFEYIQQKKKIYLKNFCYNKSIKRRKTKRSKGYGQTDYFS